MILLLDVMGTLVYEPFHTELPAFFEMTLQELYAAKHPDTWKRFERGEIDEAELGRRYFTDGRDCDVDGFRDTLTAHYRWLDGIPELLQDLAAAGVPMHTLSNYCPWYRCIEEKLEVSRWVAWSFVSCELGVRKPDPQAYLIPAERLGVRPAECLFVDDRQKNVDGARAVGMQSLRFTGAAELRAELAARGLLGSGE